MEIELISRLPVQFLLNNRFFFPSVQKSLIIQYVKVEKTCDSKTLSSAMLLRLKNEFLNVSKCFAFLG